MQNDEQAIRNMIDRWMAASKAGDTETVLSLMADDVVFMVPGKEPFGKAAFAESGKLMKNVQIDGQSDIVEIKVLGDWAWMRNHLNVTMTMPDGKVVKHSGYTLTILHKDRNGQWIIKRDANLLTAK